MALDDDDENTKAAIVFCDARFDLAQLRLEGGVEVKFLQDC